MKEESAEEMLGPDTDIVISLFSMTLVIAALAGALFVRERAVLAIIDETLSKPEPTHKPPNSDQQMIVLDPVSGGDQFFDRKRAELDSGARQAIERKLRPLHDAFRDGAGRLLIHVAGYASPEPFGSGKENFELALGRALSVAELIHNAFEVPFECLRVHGNGRGESEALDRWFDDNASASLGDWDENYTKQREAEKKSWTEGELLWGAAYSKGETNLGRALGVERRVILGTEEAKNRVCERALRTSVGAQQKQATEHEQQALDDK